jgi:hypothetical protein
VSGHAARMVEMLNAYKYYLKEIEYEGVYWIQLAQDEFQ